MGSEVLAASLAGAGVMVVLSGVLRARRRTATADRLLRLVTIGEPAPSAASSAELPRMALRLQLERLVARVRSHERSLRTPAVAIALIAGLLGLATVSIGWLVVAGLAAGAAYAFNGEARRQARIEAQALGTMQLLSAGLRAGYSVPQAIALVARESPRPTASEFQLVNQELNVGVSLTDSIAHLAERTGNADYQLVSIIVGVQHEVGGNLALILDSVGETLRERVELRRQVAAVTAQQRMSSIVLTILPFALLALLALLDRTFVEPLFTETAGRIMLALAGLMILIGWSIMRSIGRIEV
jgi:tight adherence protein B